MSSSPSPPTFSGADASMAGAPSQLAISNGVLLAAVIFLFMVVVFVFLLYLYAKRFLGANPMLNGAGSTPSSRFIFVGDSPFPGRGLPASLLRSLPVAVYASGASPRTPGAAAKHEALECAVCLSEVADGEKVRTLPKCDHRFHVECIDMWFHSHDTCPLCRAPVGADAAAEGLPRVPREDPAIAVDFPLFPTNILFWGTHDDVTNAGLGMPPPPPAPAVAASSSSSSASGLRKENLVIDIPNRPMTVGASMMSSSPLPASRMAGSADDLRSPMSARLRSLRRLLSRGKQAVAGTSSSSPRGGDIEQGLAGRPPKTPKTPPSSH